LKSQGIETDYGLLRKGAEVLSIISESFMAGSSIL
jgi:hypothetical protein